MELKKLLKKGNSESRTTGSIFSSLKTCCSASGLWLSDVETVPPDLLTLTGACVKLRMTQQPPLQSGDASTSTSSLFHHLHHILKFNLPTALRPLWSFLILKTRQAM